MNSASSGLKTDMQHAYFHLVAFDGRQTGDNTTLVMTQSYLFICRQIFVGGT
jgi:hypothetical protein